jgi:hypothetical protein
MERHKVNFKVIDTQTMLEETVTEFCEASVESSYLVTQSKITERGINTKQYFTESRYNKRFMQI